MKLLRLHDYSLLGSRHVITVVYEGDYVVFTCEILSLCPEGGSYETDSTEMTRQREDNLKMRQWEESYYIRS